MTPRQAAELAGMPHEVILTAVHSGRLPAKKHHRRWCIKPAKAWRFGRVNRARVDVLADEYISPYWQGRGVDWLQARVKADFAKRHIVWPVAGFAEQTIYNSIKNQQATANQ